MAAHYDTQAADQSAHEYYRGSLVIPFSVRVVRAPSGTWRPRQGSSHINRTRKILAPKAVELNGHSAKNCLVKSLHPAYAVVHNRVVVRPQGKGMYTSLKPEVLPEAWVPTRTIAFAISPSSASVEIPLGFAMGVGGLLVVIWQA